MTRTPLTGKRACQHPRAQHQHGTYNAYNEDNCRCFPCRLAKNKADQAKPGYRDAGSSRHRIGLIRRLEALHAIGWSGQKLADQLGMTKDALNNLRTWPGEVIYQTTHSRICALYDELWDRKPPLETKGDRIAYARTVAWAKRQRFAPPLFWDDGAIDDPDAEPADNLGPVLDEVAIREAMNGRPVHLTRQERAAAIARLDAAGYSTTEIGERLGVTSRTASRERARRRREAAA